GNPLLSLASLDLYVVTRIVIICLLFFFYLYGDHRDLHSFPTRRSSDLAGRGGAPDRPHGLRCAASPRRPPPASPRPPSCTPPRLDRKSTRLNSSHVEISYAVFCLKKKKRKERTGSTT